MADIKTRNIKKGTVKALDRSAVIADKTKSAVIRTKEGTENNLSPKESSAEEYASGRVQEAIQDITDDAVHQFTKRGRNGIRDTKDNIEKVKKNVKKIKDSFKKGNKSKKAVQKTAQTTKKTVQQTTKTTSKTVKTATKSTIKTAQKSVKTAQTAGKVAVKTTKESAKAAKVAAKASAKAAQAAARSTRAMIKATVTGVKLVVKVVVVTVKVIVSASKAIIAAIASGGWIAVIVIVVICIIALILCSCFGVFFTNEVNDDELSLQSVIYDLNTEYYDQIDSLKNEIQHDECVITDSGISWPEVLAVYSVSITTDTVNASEAFTMDESKRAILENLFWQIYSISSHTESVEELVITQTIDEYGNVVENISTCTRIYLYIDVICKSNDEMKDYFDFNDEQRMMLDELLSEEYYSLWSYVLN